MRLSKVHKLYPEGGLFSPGLMHASGTALTLELQEDSDAMAFLYASCGEEKLSKALFTWALTAEDLAEKGEAAILDWINWPLNKMADFRSRYSITSHTITQSDNIEVAWILWGSAKFQAKRSRLAPGANYMLRERGVYSVFVWKGSGCLGEHVFMAGTAGKNEFLITKDRVVSGVKVSNHGTSTAQVVVFFGPDINDYAPLIAAL